MQRFASYTAAPRGRPRQAPQGPRAHRCWRTGQRRHPHVADWLAQWRATTLAVSDRKPSSREMYTHQCRKHLEAAPFGAITLDRLRPTDVEGLPLALRCKICRIRRCARCTPCRAWRWTGRAATGCSQAAEQLRAAYQWQNSGLVFSTELGTPAQPRNILGTVESAAAKAGMEGVGACTPCATPQRRRGSRQACTSKRWPICSGTPLLVGGELPHAIRRRPRPDSRDVKLGPGSPGQVVAGDGHSDGRGSHTGLRAPCSRENMGPSDLGSACLAATRCRRCGRVIAATR